MTPPGSSTYLFDVVIIGAGISGINTAYRLQNELPNKSYVILEARDAIGGTWDLFRYPGIRSDSDLHTFGFSWRPWLEDKSIADGESIRKYVLECAQTEGIDKNIRFRQRVIHGNWSSVDQKWSLIVDDNGQEVEYSARFIQVCTGYYNYKEPLPVDIPGIQNFKGTVIHPQFWPEDLDYTNKKIVIIGSGATAVTLFPVLAKKAAQVILLQRSPTYILALPAVDKSAKFLRKFLPVKLVSRLMRIKFLILPFCFVRFCRFFPSVARSLLRYNCEKFLPSTISHDPHFNPKYNPWDQRLCLSPDGDFYKALHDNNNEVVTDTIHMITENKVLTKHGKVFEPDIIIKATGLKVQLVGGATLSKDGELIDASSKCYWRGAMLQDIPNMAFVGGYTNASWTLGADTTAYLVCRLLKYMDSNEIMSAVPSISKDEKSKIQISPSLDLNSTYIERAKDVLPKSGGRGPWQYKKNFFADLWQAKLGNLQKGLYFVKKSKID